MKKSVFGILALMMALTMLCSACSGGDKPEPTESPEATELPSVTAPPLDENGNPINIIGADANNPAAGNGIVDRESWLASLSEEQRLVEETLIGKSVEELYKAIGKPLRSSYGVSCLVANAEDGILYYDGFMVTTVRYPNGSEIIFGTDN